MLERPLVRVVLASDHDAWLRLWNGYNAFYGRSGGTALAEEITRVTWQRFFVPGESVHALVAESGDAVVGLAHYVFHRSTSRLNDVCYLHDLFTDPQARRQGIAGALIRAVYQAAQAAGSSRVYWQTQSSNDTGRRLYDTLAKHSGFIVYAHEFEQPPGGV